jgi:carbon-monoxide dehydrogenase medium subunit
MSLWKNYLVPTSIEEAVTALNGSDRPAAVIAGGTDLLLDLDQGRHPAVDTLVDITRIDEMKQVRLDADGIFIGAAVTHNDIVHNPILQEHAQCLVEGCGLIGGPQVRNVATIGGNVAHALPAGDGTIALVALNARARVVSREGEKWQPIAELFAGPGKTTFDRTKEILTGFRIQPSQGSEASAFERVMRPQGVAIAILNMAVWMRLDHDQVIDQIRIAVGPGGPVPFRAFALEDLLRGRTVDDETLELAARSLLEELHLRTSKHRATEAYRRHLIATLLQRTVDRISKRAREKV